MLASMESWADNGKPEVRPSGWQIAPDNALTVSDSRIVSIPEVGQKRGSRRSLAMSSNRTSGPSSDHNRGLDLGKSLETPRDYTRVFDDSHVDPSK